MIILSQEEFKAQGTYIRETAQVLLQKKFFEKGPSFSKESRAKAIDFCQSYLTQNISCLLVESPLLITIWIENQRQNEQPLPPTSVKASMGTSQKQQLQTEEAVLVAQKTFTNAIASPPSIPLVPQEKKVVACIDDSKTVQKQVRMTLEAAGYEVLSITEPASTLTLLVRHQPSVILMDINMPEIDGYELCQMLHRSRRLREIPIIMLTGREGMLDRFRAKLTGAVNYITKPFEPNQLIEAIQKVTQVKFSA